MVGLAQERLAGGLGREHARLAFDAELALETAVARNQANDRLGEVDVEIVADDIPPCVRGGAAQHVAEKSREILLISVRVLPRLDALPGPNAGHPLSRHRALPGSPRRR